MVSEWKCDFIKNDMSRDVDTASGWMITSISFVRDTISQEDARKRSRFKFVLGVIPQARKATTSKYSQGCIVWPFSIQDVERTPPIEHSRGLAIN